MVTASATTRTTAEARGWGALKASDDSFNYEIPAGVDIDAVGSVVIWCRAFSVLFATASLDAARALVPWRLSRRTCDPCSTR
ncbi:MAG: DM13 domain-containing protein [Chloroflexi bacterium]|nr:DM13 domain-containing protein [Chloroflexota bacterium]